MTQELRNLYEITGDIKDINTMLVQRNRMEKAEKEPEITPAMIQAAEEVEDLYRRGTPDTWKKVFRAMWRAMEASK